MKGILLVNLGTPDAPTRSAVYRYLKQFLLDPRVIDINPIARNLLVRGIIVPFRSGQSAKLYKELWTENGSPLKYYGEILAEYVQKTLGEDYVVELAMRYQNPSLPQAIDKLYAKKVSEIIVLPLFPHYASASTGSVHEEVMRLLSKKLLIPTVKLINSFPTYQPMIEVFIENAKQFDIDSYDHILFSYHGLPKRQMTKADDFNHCKQSENCCMTLTETNQFCYSAQCYSTTKAIVEGLNLKEGDYTTCFQSRLGRAEWIQPYTSDALKVRAEKGDKRLLVFCPAFVADCLETTIEVSVEYQEEFEELGGEHVQLVPSLNDNPKWMQSVVDLVKSYE